MSRYKSNSGPFSEKHVTFPLTSSASVLNHLAVSLYKEVSTRLAKTYALLQVLQPACVLRRASAWG